MKGKSNFWVLIVFYQVFLEYFTKILYFSVLFINHGNFSRFKFGKYLHSFWREFFFTRNKVVLSFGHLECRHSTLLVHFDPLPGQIWRLSDSKYWLLKLGIYFVWVSSKNRFINNVLRIMRHFSIKKNSFLKMDYNDITNILKQFTMKVLRTNNIIAWKTSGPDPSWWNSTIRQNPQFQQDCRKWWTNDAIFGMSFEIYNFKNLCNIVCFMTGSTTFNGI